MQGIVKGAVAALGVLALAVPAAAQQSKNPVLTAQLAGAAGSGSFTAVFDPAQNQMCYILNARGIAEATAAHVHTGAAGEAGEPLITLATPEDGSSGDCAEVSADVAQALLANPAGYYVNVHNAEHPAGALRGQLGGLALSQGNQGG